MIISRPPAPPLRLGDTGKYIMHFSIYIEYNRQLQKVMLIYVQVYALAKEEALLRAGEPTSVVREAAIRRAMPDAATRLESAPKRACIDKVIQRTRKRQRPADPATLSDDLDLTWIAANAPHLEIVKDIRTMDSRIIIFSTIQQMSTLSSAELWLCDGTFKVHKNGGISEYWRCLISKWYTLT